MGAFKHHCTGLHPPQPDADRSGASGEEGTGLPANPPLQQSQLPPYLGRRGVNSSRV